MRDFVFLFLIFLSLFTKGQKKENQWNDSIKSSTDVAAYLVARTDINKNKPVIWVTHESGKFFYEVRGNFDACETAGILAGKTFALKNGSFWITPKVGVLFALNDQGYDGISVENNLGGKFAWSYYFSMNQFSFSLKKSKPNFFYGFSTFGFQYWRMRIAYSFQLYYEMNSSSVWIDHGPQMTILLNHFYLKPWYTWDPGHKKLEKFVLGFGYQF